MQALALSSKGLRFQTLFISANQENRQTVAKCMGECMERGEPTIVNIKVKMLPLNNSSEEC